MIKNFILSVMGAVLLSSAFEMIMPDGSMKKYFRLAMGFVMMGILASPLVSGFDLSEIKFSFDETVSEEELLAESEAYMLKIHENNINERIKELCGENVQVYTRVFSDGKVESVTIKGSNIDSDVVKKVKEEVGCENIEVISGEESEN